MSGPADVHRTDCKHTNNTHVTCTPRNRVATHFLHTYHRSFVWNLRGQRAKSVNISCYCLSSYSLFLAIHSTNCLATGRRIFRVYNHDDHFQKVTDATCESPSTKSLTAKVWESRNYETKIFLIKRNDLHRTGEAKVLLLIR